MAYQVEISHLDQAAMFDVRSVHPDDLENWFSSHSVLDGATEMNRMIVCEEFEVLRIGPRRAIITSTLENEAWLEQQLSRDLAATRRVGVVNVSDYYLGIRVRGPDALTVLAHALPLDLHLLNPGSGTATVVFSIAGIVICERADSFAVLVDRSYFDYVLQRMAVCGLVASP